MQERVIQRLENMLESKLKRSAAAADDGCTPRPEGALKGQSEPSPCLMDCRVEIDSGGPDKEGGQPVVFFLPPGSG